MKNLIVLTVAWILLAACHKNDPTPEVEMLTNVNAKNGFNSMSLPTGWYVAHLNTAMVVKISDSISFSPSHSISISAVNPSTDFYSIGQSVGGTLPLRKDLTLNLKVKANLQGEGVAVAIRTDNPPTYDVLFVTTQGATAITGTFDWKVII